MKWVCLKNTTVGVFLLLIFSIIKYNDDFTIRIVAHTIFQQIISLKKMHIPKYSYNDHIAKNVRMWVSFKNTDFNLCLKLYPWSFILSYINQMSFDDQMSVKKMFVRHSINFFYKVILYFFPCTRISYLWFNSHIL